MFTLAIPELAVLAAVKFLLYAAEWAALDYYAESLRLDHIRSGMFILLPPSLVNVLSRNGFNKFAELMRVNFVLAALEFHQMTEIDWSLLGVQMSLLHTISQRARSVVTLLRDSLR